MQWHARWVTSLCSADMVTLILAGTELGLYSNREGNDNVELVGTRLKQ